MDKINSADIDQIISSELLNAVEDPELLNIVQYNMIHEPCGTINLLSPCMKDGRCSKQFPKSFAIATQTKTYG